MTDTVRETLDAINEIAKLAKVIEKDLLKDYNPKRWVAKYGKGQTPKDVASMLARKALG